MEGGVGTTSSRVRRARSRRGVFPGIFWVARLEAEAFRAVFLAGAALRFEAFAFDFARLRRYVTSLVRGTPEHYVGHNPAGSYVIVAMLATAVLTGLTGYLTLRLPDSEIFEEVHEAVANAWLGLVIVHIAGVLVSSFAHRENLVRAMVTGYKSQLSPRVRPGAMQGGQGSRRVND